MDQQMQGMQFSLGAIVPAGCGIIDLRNFFDSFLASLCLQGRHSLQIATTAKRGFHGSFAPVCCTCPLRCFHMTGQSLPCLPCHVSKFKSSSFTTDCHAAEMQVAKQCERRSRVISQPRPAAILEALECRQQAKGLIGDPAEPRDSRLL